MRARSALFPAANIGSRFGFLLVIAGFILYSFGAAFGPIVTWIGVGFFAAAVLFSLVTLPVEFNASRRARQMLKATGLVSTAEYDGASAVLSAAALTYVAAMLQAAAPLFYFVLMAVGMGRR